MKRIILVTALLSTFGSIDAQNSSIPKQASCPHLVFKIANGMCRLPAAIVTSITDARVEMSDFSKTEYILQKFTFILLSNEMKTFSEVSNHGNKFSDKTKKILASVKPKDILIVSDIAVKNQKGEIVYLEDRTVGFY